MGPPDGDPQPMGPPTHGPPLPPPGALWQTLLALLGLYPGLCPSLPAAPRPRPPDPRADLDSVVSLAKALLSDTKAFLLQLRSRFPAEGEHKLDSLPVLSMSALELSNIQPPGALSRLSADLQRYQRHLEWLRRAGPALRPLEAELGALHARLERLLRRLDHLLSRLSLSRPNDPHPALPPPGSPWAAVQAAHAVLRGLHLHLDWASRALVLLRNRL